MVQPGRATTTGGRIGAPTTTTGGRATTTGCGCTITGCCTITGGWGTTAGLTGTVGSDGCCAGGGDVETARATDAATDRIASFIWASPLWHVGLSGLFLQMTRRGKILA